MSIDVFRFPSAALAEAFETGALFFWSDPPFSTELKSTVLIVRGEHGDTETTHEYRWEDVSGAPDDLGSDLLVSTIACPTAEIAMAFACGLFRYAGAFVGIAMSGASVIVTEKREEGEEASELSYDYRTLRSLISAHRAGALSRPDPASA